MPGSSELLLLYQLFNGGEAWLLVAVATLGNILGSIITFLMGLAGNHALHKRWLGIDEQAIKRAEQHYQRWGIYSLLLAWLPVIGDPLCLLAGLLRINWKIFVVLVGIGKLARYSALVWLATSV